MFLDVVKAESEDLEDDVDEDFFPIIGFRVLFLHDCSVLYAIRRLIVVRFRG